MKLTLIIAFIISYTMLNAQVKLSDLKQSFVEKSKQNQTGVVSSLNGGVFTGTIESYEKVHNEKTFFKFKDGVLVSHIRTRNDSVFYKTTFLAGMIHITERPFWRSNVKQSSISYHSNNKIDSIHWFLEGKPLAKIYYTYPEQNVKTEKFYHCLNQDPALNYECSHYYECDDSQPTLMYYPCAVNSLLSGKETYYDLVTGDIVSETVYEIKDGRSVIVSSTDEIEVKTLDYLKLEFVNQNMIVNGKNGTHYVAKYKGKLYSGVAVWKHSESITTYHFENGKLNGSVTEANLNGEIDYSCQFIDGKKEGEEFELYANTENEVHFNRFYYTQGILDSAFHYKNKIQNDKVYFTYSNSLTRTQTVYKLYNGQFKLSTIDLQTKTIQGERNSPIDENAYWTTTKNLSRFDITAKVFLTRDQVIFKPGESSSEKLVDNFINLIKVRDSIGILGLTASYDEFNETIQSNDISTEDRAYYRKGHSKLNQDLQKEQFLKYQYDLEFLFELLRDVKKIKIKEIEEVVTITNQFNGATSKIFKIIKITIPTKGRDVIIHLVLLKTKDGWKLFDEITVDQSKR